MDIKSLLKLIPVILLLSMFTGCATIVGSWSNSLVFKSPQNIQADVFVDDSLVGQAPGKIKLSSRFIQHGSVVEIKADGYETQEYLILRKIQPLYATGNLFIGAIPMVVDLINGQIYRPSPRRFNYELKKAELN